MEAKPGLSAKVAGAAKHEDNIFKDHFRVRSPRDEGPSGPSSSQMEFVSLLLFTMKQVQSVINSMRRGKSPGHDGLSIEHLKYAGTHMPRVLSLFFIMCLSYSYLPAAHRKE